MSPRPFPRTGLYVIADDGLLDAASMAGAVAAAVRGGAAAVQLRCKSTPPAGRRALALDLARACADLGVPLIVNDDLALAREAGADGVHVGRDDASCVQARRVLGVAAAVGVSCNDSLERAVAAEAAGASYVAFGRFFASRTKPDAVPAPARLLRRARGRLRVPLVAIGGITPHNGAALLAAGADVLAVVHGVFGQPDPEAAARAYADLFDRRRAGDARPQRPPRPGGSRRP